ncbi:MAG: hypothetical protein IKN12_08700 [Selenomonadaceae bacterium]|nr:hypothetical protein [Selenomonadaceae bacterium]
MKKIIFLAHDPGGSDVIAPVYKAFPTELYDKIFYAAGPAGDKYETYRKDKEDILRSLEAYLKQNELQCLVTGTSWADDTEIRSIAMCKSAQVVTVSVLDYWSNYAKRFLSAESGETIYPDFYFMMDDIAKKEAIADGVPESIIKVVGHPGLDKYLLKNKSKDSKPKTRVLFLSQPLSALYGKSLGFNEYDVMEDLMSICKELSLPLSIKFHPKDSMDFKAKYQKLSINGDTDEAMLNSKIVVGMNTMALLYGALMGVSVISYQPNLLQKDMCITNRLSIGKACFTKAELYDGLKNCGKSGESVCGKLFQPATENVVGEIMRIAQTER